MTDQQFTDPAEIRHPIGRSGSFSLNNISGDIRVRGTDTDEAVVVARSSRGRQEWLPIAVRKAEGMLAIAIEQKGPFFGWGRGRADVEFDITLPRGARVDITAVSADIQATGLVGEQSYKTVSGDVALERVGGRISLTSVSGDVRLEGTQLVEPRAGTTSGDLEITAPNLRAMQLRTVSGDAQVRGGFDTGALHTIETVSGDVDIESTTGLTVEFRKGIDLGGGLKQRVVGDGAARLRFRSLSGDLHVMSVGGERGVRDQPFAPPQPNSLEILQALERGEIDIEEAQRRLEGAGSRG
ncbi:MAG: DUF4097 family beta strand repeat-containing protein [Chloroflexota bacterium]|nr:DUF4097 family beta strand repeat-containing protein [Chloroflexota bacterium]